MKNKDRYVQPHNTFEAMQTIEQLFNQYRHAILTDELLAYHQQLVQRLQTDIYEAAITEDDQKQLKNLNQMISSMQTWTRTKMMNRPFHYKMKHFKLLDEQPTTFKNRAIKNNGAKQHLSGGH
ncbi:hypothetical protein LOOC260_111910 [Paucilactobacillus hokkaidonensis JCM 18461]|uniref:Uncharacterized protein n=2 Tax=Paucilactobacillus hokkaidonensis TaxID=1193095 RepID=A0A0A1GUS7_9LACO|nr:hypothetical protein [Paucilactobacillus hokkaidonensis]KRO10738.1 hypothetical protein IV59_GL001429 [Paucilactobacillus hokkaidonensis]BAP85730.1 hypothetical protein LOOC260_111910 [Paucilactobacillus hokkaidonensis JCM 18461]